MLKKVPKAQLLPPPLFTGTNQTIPSSTLLCAHVQATKLSTVGWRSVRAEGTLDTIRDHAVQPSILQMGKLRPREAKRLVQDHTRLVAELRGRLASPSFQSVSLY